MALLARDEKHKNIPARYDADEKRGIVKAETITEWLYKQGDYGICPPPMSDKTALEFLKNYLLDEDWYAVLPMPHEQVNTALVHDILYKYSKRYRKEYKKRRLKNNEKNNYSDMYDWRNTINERM